MPESTTRSLSFLDLPKELRLMVYEYLSPVITTRHHTLIDRSYVPTPSTPTSRITLVKKSVSTEILATCRLIDAEARPLFAPVLKKLRPEPVRFIIDWSSLEAFLLPGGILNTALRVVYGVKLRKTYPIQLKKYITLTTGDPGHALAVQFAAKAGSTLEAVSTLAIHCGPTVIGQANCLITIVPPAYDDWEPQLKNDIRRNLLRGLTRMPFKQHVEYSVLWKPDSTDDRWRDLHAETQEWARQGTRICIPVDEAEEEQWKEQWEEGEAY